MVKKLPTLLMVFGYPILLSHLLDQGEQGRCATFLIFISIFLTYGVILLYVFTISVF